MVTTLTLCRYPSWAIPFAVLSMALFRFPLWINRQVSFYKLMGTGKNGTFDKHPEWREWAVLVVHQNSHAVEASSTTALHQQLHGIFIAWWWKWFRVETCTIQLEAVEGHGLWDGEQPFPLAKQPLGDDEKLAVLTRATIRLNRLNAFWSRVDQVAQQMAGAPGFVTSIGIGEIPYIKQATFSVWTNKHAMKAFAYRMAEHQDVIRRTRQEKWYSEELFMRFRIGQTWGSWHGQQPFS
jgi:hypothetical protein